MDWQQQYLRWESARLMAAEHPRLTLEAEARKDLNHQKNPDVTWHIEALLGTGADDQGKRLFLINVLRVGNQMPRQLFAPMLRAAIYERNPSFNRSFIEPCMRCFGPRRVNEELIANYMESGTDSEKAGVASAFYWSFGLNGYRNIQLEDLSDLDERVKCWGLTEFVRNEDLDVRRRIIPGLELDPEKYPESLRQLIPEAIRIARSHPDDYIRHRIEIQLGEAGPFLPLPS